MLLREQVHQGGSPRLLEAAIARCRAGPRRPMHHGAWQHSGVAPSSTPFEAISVSQAGRQPVALAPRPGPQPVALAPRPGPQPVALARHHHLAQAKVTPNSAGRPH